MLRKNTIGGLLGIVLFSWVTLSCADVGRDDAGAEPRLLYMDMVADAPAYPAQFPYRVGLMVSDFLDLDKALTVALHIYQGEELLQVLDVTEVNGYMPVFEDFNFDGYMDIAISEQMSNSPSFSHQYWLYDPHTQRFVDAPESLQMIPSPEVDVAHQQIHHFWRGSCCSHGIDVYQWEDGEMALVEGAGSYRMPIRLNEEILSCYNTPYYDWQTGEVMDYLRLVQNKQGELSLQMVEWNADQEGYVALSQEAVLDNLLEQCGEFYMGSPYPHLSLWRDEQGGLKRLEDMEVEQVEFYTEMRGEDEWQCHYWRIPYFDMLSAQVEWLVDRTEPYCEQR